jgi:integrase
VPYTQPPQVYIDRLVTETCVSGKRRSDIFNAWVRSLQHTVISYATVHYGRALVRNLRVNPPPRFGNWNDVRAYCRVMTAKLSKPTAGIARRGLYMAAEQLMREGEIDPRVRNRDKAVCRGCGKLRRIGNVERMLCECCVGEGTLQQRFDDLCKQYRFSDPGRNELIGALLDYERQSPASNHAMMRLWGFGTFLESHGPIPVVVQGWPDIVSLKNAIREDSMSGRSHQASWALYKVSEVLIERGVLYDRPAKTLGSSREQLLAVREYFDVDDPNRRDLLDTLIQYYLATRVTITAVQVVWAWAYHLRRQPLPTITSWVDFEKARATTPAPGQRWRRRILTAFCRLGDALVKEGRLPPRPDKKSASFIIERLCSPTPEICDINTRFIESLDEHGRRPSTLIGYVSCMNQFWDHMINRGISHPAQINREDIRRYLCVLKKNGVNVTHIEAMLRIYFSWLRRERLIMGQPVSSPEPQPTSIVRVCSHEDIESLIKAVIGGALSRRDALILYFLIFHGLRNWEIVEAQGIGFLGKGDAEVFGIRLPHPVISIGQRQLRRIEPNLSLPTGRYEWLKTTVTDILEERASILKHVDNPYLFVSDSWRQNTHPMLGQVVNRAVERSTKLVLGRVLVPSIIRQGAGAYFADNNDHTYCSSLMGWSPKRAIQIAYNPREIVVNRSSE